MNDSRPVHRPGSPLALLVCLTCVLIALTGCAGRDTRPQSSESDLWASLIDTFDLVSEAETIPEPELEVEGEVSKAPEGTERAAPGRPVTVIETPSSVSTATAARAVHEDERAAAVVQDPDPPDDENVVETAFAGAAVGGDETPPVYAEAVSGEVVAEDGFRVQIFASQQYDRATGLVERARATLEDPVYLDFEDPWYKVRVGDFKTKLEAGAVATRLSATGYAGAWVVGTTINVFR